MPVKIIDLQAEMMPRIGGNKLLVRHTMKFNPGYSGFKPDPTQGFYHFGSRFFFQSKNPTIKTAHPRSLTGRKGNCHVLKFWRHRFIRVHTDGTFESNYALGNAQSN